MVEYLITLVLCHRQVDLPARLVLVCDLLLPLDIAPHALQVLILILHERRHTGVFFADHLALVSEVLHVAKLIFVELLLGLAVEGVFDI